MEDKRPFLGYSPGKPRRGRILRLSIVFAALLIVAGAGYETAVAAFIHYEHIPPSRRPDIVNTLLDRVAHWIAPMPLVVWASKNRQNPRLILACPHLWYHPL
jgi:hypothetical protein